MRSDYSDTVEDESQTMFAVQMKKKGMGLRIPELIPEIVDFMTTWRRHVDTLLFGGIIYYKFLTKHLDMRILQIWKCYSLHAWKVVLFWIWQVKQRRGHGQGLIQKQPVSPSCCKDISKCGSFVGNSLQKLACWDLTAFMLYLKAILGRGSHINSGRLLLLLVLSHTVHRRTFFCPRVIWWGFEFWNIQPIFDKRSVQGGFS